jgi:hypothetical protein
MAQASPRIRTPPLPEVVVVAAAAFWTIEDCADVVVIAVEADVLEFDFAVPNSVRFESAVVVVGRAVVRV